VVAAVFALIVGLPLLRLRGHYFAVANPGGRGRHRRGRQQHRAARRSNRPLPPIIRSDLLFFYLMLGAAILAVLTTWVILRTRFGYGLLAIRENEEAAAVIGVNTTFYKVAAFLRRSGADRHRGRDLRPMEQLHQPGQRIRYLRQRPDDPDGGHRRGRHRAGAGCRSHLSRADHPDAAGGGTSSVYSQIGLGVLLAVCVIFIPRGVIDFFGGRSRLSLRYSADPARDQRMSLLAVNEVSSGSEASRAGRRDLRVDQVMSSGSSDRTAPARPRSQLHQRALPPGRGRHPWETTSIRAWLLTGSRGWESGGPPDRPAIPSMRSPRTRDGCALRSAAARLQPGAALKEAIVSTCRGAGRETPLSRAAVDGPGPEAARGARALAMRPRLLWLDEVMGGLNKSRSSRPSRWFARAR